ncbi:MAG: PadR family transcriptional regulator [Woeseiaceae bacterium]|nr:PadR family transcriptional regulator [Woeseiaceae bacterium]
MDVKTVCLGMLSDGEASGYDLKKQFESTFAHFFAAGYGSIYPALSALAAEGLVECREIAQDGKPDRKVYRITDAGIQQLRDALKKPNPSHKVRSEFLAMMVFAHLMTREQIDTIMASRIADIDRDLELIQAFENACLQNSTPGMRYVCGCGKAVMQAMKKYIEENRDLHTEFENAQRTGTGH